MARVTVSEAARVTGGVTHVALPLHQGWEATQSITALLADITAHLARTSG